MLLDVTVATKVSLFLQIFAPNAVRSCPIAIYVHIRSSAIDVLSLTFSTLTLEGAPCVVNPCLAVPNAISLIIASLARAAFTYRALIHAGFVTFRLRAAAANL